MYFSTPQESTINNGVTINTGVFPEKMCSYRRKSHGCGQKKPDEKALALLGLASGSLPNTLNSRVVPTEFAAEPTTKMKSSKANS